MGFFSIFSEKTRRDRNHDRAYAASIVRLRMEREFQAPAMSDWHCEAFGIRYRPRKGCEPNAFCRLMGRWLLGIRWVKEPLK